MIKRIIYKNLLLWKKTSNRKPLILKGARQVGKSFLVEEFGKKEFRKIHKINFQSNKRAHILFDGDLSPKELIQKIEYLLTEDIDIKKDLLFFDEIQECPKAINSLKFFFEEMKELAIISAGSYLGLMKNEEAFPVGKIDFLSMFPLTYEEFLMSINPKLYKFYESINIENIKAIDNFIHNELLETFYLYLAIGGMPEVVQTYISYKDNMGIIELLNKLRKIQNNLIESYKSDFSKHGGVLNSSHILSVYESVPYQLSKSFDDEVDKFKFTGVIPNQKGYDRIIGPLTWLSKARLVIKNFIISEIEHPLKSHHINNKFKIFFHDTGLLNASLDSPMTSFTDQSIGSYKGYIIENFVAQELFSIFDSDLTSWTKGQSEIEFIVVSEGNIIPLEVKSSAKSRKAKSLDSYIKRYNPKIAYKVSAQNYGYNKSKGFKTIPLYLIGKIF